MAIQFWFEFASTYSYPAAMRVEARGGGARRRRRVEGVSAGTDLPEPGLERFAVQPLSGEGPLHVARSRAHCATRAALPFVRPSQFPRNGLLAARVACACASEPGCRPSCAPCTTRTSPGTKTSRARGGRALPRERRRAPRSAGSRAAGSEANKAKLRAQSEEAERLGLFGAPSFVVGAGALLGQRPARDGARVARRCSTPAGA